MASFSLITSHFATAQKEQDYLFDATITTNQEEFYIYEEITATFNFSSHITDSDYFAFGIAENIGFDPIIQSEAVQGNFSKSEFFTFCLLSNNYSFSGDNIVLYLLLYYYEGVFGDEICCSKPITLHKANLQCDFPANYTEINTSINYNLTFHLFDLNNKSFVLKEEEVICMIEYDSVLHHQFTILSSIQGRIQILITVEDPIELCTLHLYANSSRYFVSAHVSFQFKVLHSSILPNPPTHPSSLFKLFVIITVSVCSGGTSVGLVYIGIRFYQKELKRTYDVKSIKI